MQLRSRGVFPINSPDGGPGHRVFYGAYYDEVVKTCLLYTSDAADERSSVDLGGRRIIKKKTHKQMIMHLTPTEQIT